MRDQVAADNPFRIDEPLEPAAVERLLDEPRLPDEPLVEQAHSPDVEVGSGEGALNDGAPAGHGGMGVDLVDGGADVMALQDPSGRAVDRRRRQIDGETASHELSRNTIGGRGSVREGRRVKGGLVIGEGDRPPGPGPRTELPASIPKAATALEADGGGSSETVDRVRGSRSSGEERCVNRTSTSTVDDDNGDLRA